MKFIYFFNKFFRYQATDRWIKTIRWILLAAVFILPLFFLTPNSHPLEFNKTFLFNTLVLVATIIYLLKALLQRRIILPKTYLDWFVVIFIFFNLISFIFSKNHYLSLVGVSGYYSASIISVVCFVLFFYLLLLIIKSRRDVFWFLLTLLTSSALIIIFNLFQVNGVYLLPWDITKNSNFNLLVSSSTTLAIFSAICLFIGMGLLLYFKVRWQRIVSGLYMILALILLFFLDKNISLYILIISLFIFLIIVTLHSKKLSNWWVVLPTIMLIIVTLLLFVDAGSLFSVGVGESIVLDQATSAKITWRSFIKAPLWGSGPQTFSYDFATWRPASFNDSPLWNLRFIKPANEWFGWLATIGLGGTLAMLGLGIWYLFKSTQVILGSSHPGEVWSRQVILLVAWFMLALTTFLLPSSFILYFLCWFLLALGYRSFVIDSISIRQIVFKKNVRQYGMFILFFISVSLITGLLIFYGLKVWVADYHFVKAQEGIKQEADINIVLDGFQKAIELNPYETKYYINLAQGFATQALIEAAQPDTSTERIQQLTQKVIDNLKLAKEVDPDNPVVYEQETALYDSLRSLIGNVDELSIKAYSKAVELEPTSALTRLNLGRSRLILSQTILNASETEGSVDEAYSLLDQAIEDFKIARELKQDFVTTDYHLGLAYQTKGELDLALGAYQEVLNKEPNFLEAYWQRALIYEELDEVDKAIDELNRILDISPGNNQVIEKINSLESESAPVLE